MTDKRFSLVYDTEFISQLKEIERRNLLLIRTTIEQQLIYEPEVETHNRKPLTRVYNFGARWVLRFGDDNEFRIFYGVYPDQAKVHILAIGIKIREHLYIGGKEVKL